jgi:hypothetical protein
VPLAAGLSIVAIAGSVYVTRAWSRVSGEH